MRKDVIELDLGAILKFDRQLKDAGGKAVDIEIRYAFETAKDAFQAAANVVEDVESVAKPIFGEVDISGSCVKLGFCKCEEDDDEDEEEGMG